MMSKADKVNSEDLNVVKKLVADLEDLETER